MPMRNRRIRLLLLAIIIAVTFVLYSKSDPTTIAEAKQYAQRTYQQVHDQALGKVKSSSGQLVNAPAQEPKKDEPFRVDFGAYSRAAAGEGEETSAAAVNIPPPAQPVPPPPPPPKAQSQPAPIEAKIDDPMRVDFAAYSKAAAGDAEETSAALGTNNEVVANPNPIVGVVGAKDAVVPAPAKTSAPAFDASKLKKPEAGVFDGSVLPIGEGRVEVDVDAMTEQQAVHWTKLVERFPVSSTVAYPFNAGSTIPKIQHDFKNTAGAGADAEKLAVIKAAAVHSWNGYREKAMGHDEVKPVSGKYANPFNAWGATLVDSLDTLWLMGMKAEFEDALNWVKKIDFTTSKRSDIPLFETTIRYMGGLIGAYEISGRNYQILKDQAAQLGEILYGAFDTPNRMPMTYYQWKPAFASQGHRASVRTIMAEIGSLTLEFYRLGQLVGNAKYYDAISRITDALEEWQDKTRIPGLWPTTLDASGCKKLPSTDVDEFGESKGKSTDAKKGDAQVPKLPTDVLPGVKDTGSSGSAIGGKQPGLGKISNFGTPVEEGSLDSKTAKDTLFHDAGISRLARRALDTVGLSPDEPLTAAADDLVKRNTAPLAEKDTLTGSTLTGTNKEEVRSTQTPLSDEDGCMPQGFASTAEYGSDIFTLGAAADSTYEYLPKMYLLTGARVDQYRKMYLKAADAAKKWLIYRPMIPDEKRELLFAGNVDTKPIGDKLEIERDFKPVGTHLTCFVGGMFAMAGKIFDRPEDVKIGAQLTDGCIWAYNVTTTGIMPEILGLHKCDSWETCKWDQAAYYKALDPYEQVRLSATRPKTQDPRVISQNSVKDSVAGPPVGVSAAKSGFQKRQYGGGEMQYGVKPGPDGLPPAAAAMFAEAAPLHQGSPGSGNAPPYANSPYDAGASPKIPLDTSAVPPAGAKDAPALYPASPDAAAKAPGAVANSKPAPVSDNKVAQVAADVKEKIGSSLANVKDKVEPAVSNAKDKVLSSAAEIKDKTAPMVADAKEKLASGLLAANEKIPPAVPDKIAPTAPDKAAQLAQMAKDDAKDKIAPAIPGSRLAPTAPDSDAKIADIDSRLPIGSDPDSIPSKTVLGADLHKHPEAADHQEPLSHEEFVKDRIKMERLPPGMTSMYDKKYLLRPEAIESVFYMYRITGQQYWRDRGWEMWLAISKHTHAKYGASAIEDVSKTVPELHDSEESFWLAETLKYFYLLFDDPDRYSLDDWVLNTEAHFMSRFGS